MTTKQKPATPLPWIARDDGPQQNPYWHRAELFSGERLVARVEFTNGPDCDGQDGARNLAYIMHSAHAYPRLLAVVDRLQAALRANGAPNCEAMKEANALRALLDE